MSLNKMYYEATEAIIGEIEKEKTFFSFRTIVKLFTANSIASKF